MSTQRSYDFSGHLAGLHDVQSYHGWTIGWTGWKVGHPATGCKAVGDDSPVGSGQWICLPEGVFWDKGYPKGQFSVTKPQTKEAGLVGIKNLIDTAGDLSNHQFACNRRIAA